jgi:hypothetical protein
VTDWPLTCSTSGLEKVELLGELFDNLWVRAVHPGDIATLEHPLRSEGRDNPGHGPAQITKDRDGCLTRQRGGLYRDVVELVEPGKFAAPSPVCRVPPPPRPEPVRRAIAKQDSSPGAGSAAAHGTCLCLPRVHHCYRRAVQRHNPIVQTGRARDRAASTQMSFEAEPLHFIPPARSCCRPSLAETPGHRTIGCDSR